MTPTLTVFTPTYNRAYTLHLCYEGLKRQTCHDFIWLIIDDGSSDNTKNLVEKWIIEGVISIQYHYQENQGMHGAHNTAYKLIYTELNVCIDSDDYMPDNAVENIISFWKKYGSDKYAGIVGLDATRNGNIIGTKIPERLAECTISSLYGVHKVKGDKKLVYRSELTRYYPPYPIFTGEKYVPLSYKYILIDQDYPLLVMNKILCFVDYLEDGSSMNIIKQYQRNPKGFSFFRKEAMIYALSLKDRFRHAVHYVSSNLIIRNSKFLIESPYKVTTFLAIPLGIVLFLYIQNTNKTTVLKR
ncbi:glycosyltransferase family 2 protein [Cytobacillus sp. S13-E01]|uniref:glycosyltransferase family 2 protein n=1 Tax=Cytobacillus sp. S13-E01 TaxID=3031326 RepID=UPI0023D896F0|nr:glycosyltransferase family 2 protein [Cytobacillus sp. S13-E01]MDF0727772.1 glycosyltransferase family 2 protein [Cytobacillus sp. S13-E01]